MKAYKIALFVTITIACLALVWLFFPADELEIGGVALRSPAVPQASELGKSPARSQLKSVFHFETRKQRKARLEREAAEARERQIAETGFMEAMKRYENMMFLPDSGYAYFKNFFEALDSASSRRVRVAYYGDSQIEEDRITCVLRDSLQARFGGYGVGLLQAVMENGTITAYQTRAGTPPVAKIIGGRGFPTSTYGPCYSVARVSSAYHPVYHFCKHDDPNLPSRRSTYVKILADSDASFNVSVGDVQACEDTVIAPMKRYVAEMPEPVESVDIQMNGNGMVFGVMLDGENGVAVDNFALRGSSGTFFSEMDSTLLQDYLVNENVGLLVFQYGCNQVPALNGPNSMSRYGQNMYRQMEFFKRIAPNMTIIFSGPQDMKRYHYMPDVVDTLKHYALKAGVAYWSMYDAMGGEGSMAEWQQEGLAGGDGIHFSRKGGAKMGDMLYDALITYYDYYEWKKSIGN